MGRGYSRGGRGGGRSPGRGSDGRSGGRGRGETYAVQHDPTDPYSAQGEHYSHDPVDLHAVEDYAQPVDPQSGQVNMFPDDQYSQEEHWAYQQEQYAVDHEVMDDSYAYGDY